MEQNWRIATKCALDFRPAANDTYPHNSPGCRVSSLHGLRNPDKMRFSGTRRVKLCLASCRGIANSSKVPISRGVLTIS
jgi:hypothetical protein